jgi:hypothetical protein
MPLLIMPDGSSRSSAHRRADQRLQRPEADIFITDTTFRDGQGAPATLEQMVKVYDMLALGGPKGVIRRMNSSYTKNDCDTLTAAGPLGHKFPNAPAGSAPSKRLRLVKEAGLMKPACSRAFDYHIFNKPFKTRWGAWTALRGRRGRVRGRRPATVSPEDLTRADIEGFVCRSSSG